MIVRTDAERSALVEGGRILATVLGEVSQAVHPGITTAELDALAERRIRALGGEPSFKGYEGFPATLCTSVNEAVVHGIPTAEAVLKEGDLVGLDLGVLYRGFFTDMAVSVGVGRIDRASQRLLRVTEEALRLGITKARAGAAVGDIGATIQRHIERTGLGVVRQLVGHGVGAAVHEEPQVPNFGTPGKGPTLPPGSVIAIEPMVTVGSPDVHTAPDGWTVVTVDGSRAAHFEHTVLVTEGGPIVLTRADRA